jgi:hypothetical protein
MVLRIAGNLFPFKKEIGFYQFNEVQINRLAGIGVLPFLFIISFSPEFLSVIALKVSLLLLSGLLVFRYLRGFVIGRDFFTNNKFHFLIYICALEIAPLVIIIKLILEWAKKM